MKKNRQHRRLEKKQKRADLVLQKRASERTQRALSASRVPLEDEAKGIALLERLDRYAPLRNKLKEIAGRNNEWAGIPMPMGDADLIVEPRYPHARVLMGLDNPRPEEPPHPLDDAKEINSWYNAGRGGDIVVIRLPDGKVTYGLKPGVHHLKQDLLTLGMMDAWGIEQEGKAVHLLGTLVRHRQFKQYMLTGMFLESSPRSNIMYIFRRLKPTVALSMKGPEARILATLCLHPIAYYAGSWAGAMCPTDDVVAHLMLMRGDEHMFWKRANHHPPYRPEAGL